MRAVRRDDVDYRRLGRALLALAQAEAEAKKELERKRAADETPEDVHGA